ncbi:MAG: DUF11 domain-containing protein, partial [Thermomicrobiales bacterium]|nr:DUF11 domain-containing protein [Thermomicrobiales bacterium]
MVKKTAAMLRILITFVFLSGLLAPFTTFDVGAQDEPSSEPVTGVLQVKLEAADTGLPLAGACWDVFDVNGDKHPDCDFDADGMVSFELAAGPAIVEQAGGPAGYFSKSLGEQTVVAGEVRSITISVAALPAVTSPAADEAIVPADTESEPEPTATTEPTAVPPTETPVPPTEVPAPTEGPAPTPTQTPTFDDLPIEFPVDPNDPADDEGNNGIDEGTDCAGTPDADQPEGTGGGELCVPTEDDDIATDDKATLDQDSMFQVELAAVSGGSVDFEAAQPGSYNKTDGSGGGTHATSVESLNGGDFVCGDFVVFLNFIEVSSGTGDITITNTFDSRQTSGGWVGFTQAISAAVNVGDPANSTNGDEAVIVDNITNVAGLGTGPASITFRVTNLAPGEKLVIRVVAKLECRGATGGGNVQSSASSPNFSIGSQTVPLQSGGSIQPPTITVTKGCPSATSGPVGTVLVYPITVTNTSNTNLTITAATDSRPGGTFSPVAVGMVILGNSSVNLTYTSAVTAADTTNVNNTVTITAQNAFGVATSPTQGATPNCPWTITSPSVSIAKTTDTSTVSAGSPIRFTITVSNTGNGSASNVGFTDTLPSGAGISWSEDPDRAECSITAGTLTCAGITLAANDGAAGGPDQFSVTISSGTTAESCTTYNNTATLSSPYSGSSQASVTVACPDVVVSKTATVGPVNPGAAVDFTITVTNAGPGTATNVTVVDALPDGVQWSEVLDECSIAPAGDTGQQLNCTFPSMGVGAANQRVIVISGTVPSSFCGTLTNQLVTVDAANEANTGPASENNTAGPVSIAVTCPDIGVVKSAVASPINVGERIAYSIVVTNHGPGTVGNIVLSDELDSGFTWTASESEANWSCSIDGDSLLTCTFTGAELPVDGTRTVLVTSSPTTGGDCDTFSNTADVASSDESTANLENNTSTASVTVLCTDVAIAKTGNPDTIQVGSPVSYTITVTNNGSNAITVPAGASEEEIRARLLVEDTMPAGFSWTVTESVANFSCTPANPVAADTGVTCAPDSEAFSLAAGASFTITVTSTTNVTSAECGDTISNTATVTSSMEPVTGADTNNSATGTVTVQCTDVTVQKSAVDESDTPVDSIQTGTPIRFLVVTTNAGSVSAQNVITTDELPAIEGVTWSVDNAACMIGGADPEIVTCDWGTIPPTTGNTRTVTITGTYATGVVCGDVTNTATVTATNEAASDQDNNTDDATVTVQCSDVALDKTATAASIYPGDKAEFTILVTNIGDFPATGVEIEDELPAGDWTFSSEISWESDTAELTCVSAESNEPAGSGVASGTLVCTLNETMPVGGNITITLSRATEAGECLDIDNEASVTATNEQPDGEGPNSDEATIEFRCTDIA